MALAAPHTVSSLTLALLEAECTIQSLREENERAETTIQSLREENERLIQEGLLLRRTHDFLGYSPIFRMPFAGESKVPSPDSVLSHCYGALLPMFTTKEATVLRQLCKEFKTTVADFPWEDEKTVILGSVASWRACFPRARWANVTQVHWILGKVFRKTPLVDADFVHFVGLKRLYMGECNSITNAAFVRLKGIHTLDMTSCFQSTITDAAFTHLKGIHTLKMGYCDQATITDAAIAHLKGIHSLSLLRCTQLTSAVFIHLKGIKRLNIGYCPQLNLTDDSLKGIEWLGMYGHADDQVEQAESFGYPVDQTWKRGV